MKRLDAMLSVTGQGSRKECRTWIKKGLVTVNDIVITEPGYYVGEQDTVLLSGRPVFGGYMYLMMNKPVGYVSATCGDERCVLQLVPDIYRHKALFPAGRLDKETSGFLLLTDDGVFGHQVTSPKRHLKKVYIAQLDKAVGDETIHSFAEGVLLRDGYYTKPAIIRVLDKPTIAEVTLYEGKYHQIRRMFAACGHYVQRLERVQIGEVVLDKMLQPGQSRSLTEEEKKLLKNG